MSAQLIDGKSLAAQTRERVAKLAAEFTAKYGRSPALAVIKAGNDPASEIYVKSKAKACAESGIKSSVYELPDEITEQELLSLIKTLNESVFVDGILVQLPLPAHICERTALAAIDPSKDVDGFCADNAGKLFLGEKNRLVACTPRGCVALIESTGVPISGKHAVIIGRSNIVGKPVAMLLLEQNATVTICHSKTQNLKEITRQADILIAAVGRSCFVTADMVKPGAVVIDVGINRGDKLTGDVDFDAVKDVVGFITPVPGGVGPMTIAMLLDNTVRAAFAAAERSNS